MHDERDGVGRVAPVADGLDVAVVGRQHQRDARGLRAADKRREEAVVHAEDRARAHVVHGVSGDVRLEELVQGEVVLKRNAEKMLGRALRGNDRYVGVSVLYGLARQVLHQRTVRNEVVRRGDRLRNRQRHDSRHRLEAVGDKLIDRVDQVGVCEADAKPPSLQLEKQVVRLDDLSERRPGEPLAVALHRSGAVDTCEHGCLPGCRLRQTVDAEAGVDWLGVSFQETPERGTDFRVHRIVRRRRSKTESVDK